MDLLAKRAMEKRKLSLEKAMEHRASQMPRRVIEASTRLGFRRTRPGEVSASSEAYPASMAGMSIGEVFNDLDSFGLGVSLYFRQVAWIWCLVVVCALVLSPATAHNAGVCESHDTGDGSSRNHKYENSGLAGGSAAGCVRDDLAISWNVAPDLAVCLIILVGALTANMLNDVYTRRTEENLQTPSDYSLIIHNPPAHVVDPDAYREFFSKTWGDDIVAVTITKDNGGLLQLLATRKAYLQDLEDMAEGRVAEDGDLGAAGKALQPLVYGLGLLKSPDYARRELAKVHEQIADYVAESSGARAWSKPRRVVVTFATEASLERALQTFEVSAVRRLFSNWTGIELDDTPIDFEGTVLQVTKPVEPSEILWHNSHYRALDRILRMAATFGITAAGLVAIYSVASAVQKKFPGFGPAILVPLVNAALPPVLSALSRALEKHKEFGNAQDALFVKLTLARWFNTVLILFVTNSPRTRMATDTISGVMIVLLSDAFFTPLLNLFDPFDLFMRYVVAPRQATQRAMNRLWVGADWNIAERYTDIAKTLFVGLFYAAACPAGLLVTAAALLNHFLVDRYCLLRLWRRKPDFDDQLSKRNIGIISIVVIVHVAASIEFFMNWGLREGHTCDDDDAQCDEDKYQKCIGFIRGRNNKNACRLRQGSDDWDGLNDVERFVLSVFPPIGLLAIAVGLWNFIGVHVYAFLVGFLCGETYGDDDGIVPISFRDLPNVEVYVPVVPHPLAGEMPLIAADVTGVPRNLLPILPGVDPATQTVCSRDFVRAIVPSEVAHDDAVLDQVIADIFGKVSYYPAATSKSFAFTKSVSTV